MPAAPNTPPTEAEMRARRSILAREVALRDYLQRQHLELENEVSEARESAAALMDCKLASERVQQALAALKIAIKEVKDSVSMALDIHDAQVDVENEHLTYTHVRGAWDGFTPHLETIAHQLDKTSIATGAHILRVSDQTDAYYLVADCTRDSINTLALSRDALSASILSKARGLTSILHVPYDVLPMIFQFAVEEERKMLRAEFTSPEVNFERLEHMTRSIPKCSFTLAAVCRRWRSIALDMPTLWSYLRAPTWIRTPPSTEGERPLYRGVGKSAYDCSLQRAKKTPLELVLYPFSPESSEFLMGLHPGSRPVQIHIVRLTNIPSWLPVCHRLSVYGAGRPPSWNGADDLKAIVFPVRPYSPIELTCTNVIPSFNTPLNSQNFTFRSGASPQNLNIKHLSEKLPHLRTLQLLLPDFTPTSVTPWTSTQTWASLTTLAITSSALQCLATGAHEELVLPHLTTVILANMFPSFIPPDSESIKSIFRTVTLLEILDVSATVRSSDLRVFIDWMRVLESITIHGLAVEKTVEALSVVPVKAMTKLVIKHSTSDGAGLNNYAALLCGDNAQLPHVSFIDCHFVPAEVRQLFVQ